MYLNVSELIFYENRGENVFFYFLVNIVKLIRSREFWIEYFCNSVCFFERNFLDI